ncbi:MAG TPA: SRPBCC domain-containing protein [Magnetospirillaceae bacterium]|nr:SRPBCC domain-containing protein [Magnetospirillaceae bacterium]
MFDASQDTLQSRLVVDRATHSIRLTRHFAASAARVFQAWTTPEDVRCWWDPTGEPLALCEIDLRLGGAFTFVNKHHSEQPFSGTYVEISPPGRLVFDALGSRGTVSIEEKAGQTRLVVEIACASAEHLDQFLQIGVAEGTQATLDNLVAYLK